MKIQQSKYLLLIFPVIVFLFFYYYLNFDGFYGQDAYEYLRYSKAIKNYLISGEYPGDYFWPLYYPILGALLSFVFQNVGISLMLISILSLSISAYYLLKILELLLPNSSNKVVYIFTFFLLSPAIFKSSLLVMSDMLTHCFIVLVVYHYLKFKQSLKLKHFYFITIFSVAAFMTRYASAIILLPFILLATNTFFKNKKWVKHSLILVLVITVLITPHFLIRQNNTTEFLTHQWLKSWSFLNFLKSNFNTVDGISRNSLLNVLYAFSNTFHPKFIFVGLLFIPFLFVKKVSFKSKNVFWFSLILYAVFLAGIPFQNARFLILSFPLVVILFYPVFIYLSELKWLKKFVSIGIVCCIVLQFFFIKKSFSSILKRNQFEVKMAKILKPYQKNKLYSFDIDISLQGRNLDFNYQNMWRKRYYSLDNNDLVLFHPTKFKKQWQGKNPILNFTYFKENYTLKVIKELPEGWQLYKVVNE